MNKLTLLASAALLAAAGPALAADPYYAPAPQPAYAPEPVTQDWTGFYFGLHGGSGWGDVEQSVSWTDNTVGIIGPPGTVLGPFSLASPDMNGFLGGAHIGYDWQIARSGVLGVAASVSGGNLDGSSPCLVVVTCEASADWLADVTGRIGFTSGDTLYYVKGGVAFTEIDHTASITIPALPFSATGTTSTSHVGGVMGVGIEHRFNDDWSAGFEYSYYDFGEETGNLAVTSSVAGAAAFVSANPIAVDADPDIHVAKFTLNRRW